MAEVGEINAPAPVVDAPVIEQTPPASAPVAGLDPAQRIEEPVAPEASPPLSHYDRVLAVIADGRAKRSTPIFDDLEAFAKALLEG